MKQKLHPIRSKARVKRILKHQPFETDRGPLDLPGLRRALKRFQIRPVTWQEIVAHGITVPTSRIEDQEGA